MLSRKPQVWLRLGLLAQYCRFCTACLASTVITVFQYCTCHSQATIISLTLGNTLLTTSLYHWMISFIGFLVWQFSISFYHRIERFYYSCQFINLSIYGSSDLLVCVTLYVKVLLGFVFISFITFFIIECWVLLVLYYQIVSFSSYYNTNYNIYITG